MNDVTLILMALERGEPQAASELLPLVYEELRGMAAGQLAREKPGQTLDATALVHEAFLRLAGPIDTQKWESRRHFFGAAAEAMRRILVDNARRKARRKHGGEHKRVNLALNEPAREDAPEELLMVDEALDRLAKEDPQSAELVKLRYFAGLSVEEAAELAGLSRSSAYEHLAYARTWLHRERQLGR